MSVKLYERLLRPLLFRLPADRAHALSQRVLGQTAPWRLLGGCLPAAHARLATEFCGLRLRSPIGLAAGYDKDCELVPALGHLGFGFLTLGSIMAEPRPGNPLPRLARLPGHEALINAQGLPSKGRANAIANLRRLKRRPVPLLANVCDFTVPELVAATTALQPLVDALEIGLICPNTGDEGGLGLLDTFGQLVRALVAVRQVPLLVKLPPHDTPAERDLAREMVRLCVETGIDGVVVGGSQPVRTRLLASGRGGVSGRPILPRTRRQVADVAEWSAGRLPIKAGGGVFSGDDALLLLQAGASIVEIYTAFVYRGPTAAAAINRELAAALDRAGLASPAAARGVAPRQTVAQELHA